MTESSEAQAKRKDLPKMAAPDGGYGWVVVFAYFLIVGPSATTPMVFGLVYRDVFAELNLSPTEISVLLNINAAVGFGFALFNGPLIRRFGYRKMAVLGTTLNAGGLVFTSAAVSLVQIVVAYGIIASLGMGMMLQASQVAINSYFQARKSRAMGLAMTAVGACAILLPQLMVAVMGSYGSRGAGLVLAGVMLQALVGAALLQPVRHHARRRRQHVDPRRPPAPSRDEINKNENFDEGNEVNKSQNFTKSLNLVQNGGTVTHDEKIDSDTEPFIKPNNDVSLKMTPMSSKEGSEETTVLLASHGDHPEDGKAIKENNAEPSRPPPRRTLTSDRSDGDHIENKGILAIFLSKISTVLDLGIMTNALYANVIVSMSLAFASETNFSIMTPLILASMGFEAGQVATIMSSMAIIDIFARLLTPFAMERLKINLRTVYFVSIIFLIVFRSILVLLNSFRSVLVLGAGLGIAKGIRNVYTNIVIPSYVPIERLASAIGLHMAFSALLFLSFGPILGKVVEAAGNYHASVHTINGITVVAVAMWLWDLLVSGRRRSRPAAGTAP
ncbi:monocarboxylate transporter 7-like [Bacillus rossius redtenbacheri]|uniref:monocarboxylate transporter 7-like n=1 Tax=Bacillus rossius redtenbacheri TaxID=93214 RepID=UPI002FDD7186